MKDLLKTLTLIKDLKKQGTCFVTSAFFTEDNLKKMVDLSEDRIVTIFFADGTRVEVKSKPALESHGLTFLSYN